MKNTKTTPMRGKNQQGKNGKAPSSRSPRSTPLTAQKEAQIPALATRATAKAARRARACGLSITEVSGNQILKVAPDGQRTVLKEIKSGVKVTVGQKIRLR
jgi:hypothetical protein